MGKIIFYFFVVLAIGDYFVADVFRIEQVLDFYFIKCLVKAPIILYFIYKLCMSIKHIPK